jgi:FtsZ-interacting cell division protein YlmF
LAGVSGKSTVNIDKPITNEMDEMDMILDKEESTCQKNSPMVKQNMLPQKMNDEQIEKGSGKLQEFTMNSKIKVKLGQLLEICPQLRKMMTKSLLKMGEVQIANVYKVTTTKLEDFDETILVVQVHIGKFEMRDILLDGRSDANIIFESLKKKLGLRNPSQVLL